MPVQQEYVRIAARVREAIAAGRHPLGALLPTEHALADTYGVARSTIRMALDLLRTEGTIATERGIGSRVLSVPLVVTVRVGPDDWVMARLPDDAERRRLGMPAGVPVLEVFRDGRGGEVHDGSVTRISGDLLPPPRQRPACPGWG